MKTFTLCGCIVLIAFKLALAQSYEIYIYNHPFLGQIISQKGKMYVDAEAMATAVGLVIDEKNGQLIIGTPPETGVNGKVILNGKPISDIFQSKNNRTFVALKLFVEASGNKLIVNSDTKIIDIVSGDSLLSQHEMNSLQAQTSFASEAGALSQTSGGASLSEVKDAFAQIGQLEKGHKDWLKKRPDIADYLSRIAQWGAAASSLRKQLDTQMLQTVAINDKEERVKTIEAIGKNYANGLQQLAEAFSAIKPPAEFKTSYAAANKAVSSLTAIGDVLVKMIHLRETLESASTPEEKAQIQEKIASFGATIKDEIKSKANESINAWGAFVIAFKGDLEVYFKNLPQEPAP